MDEDIILFDAIKDEDFEEDKYQMHRRQLQKNMSYDEDQCEILLKDMDYLYKIIKYKHSFNEQLKKENINSIIKYLEDNYYNRGEILCKANNILRILFIPVYYKDKEDFIPSIPQNFWTTLLGKMIISCLSANDDILISTAEVSCILGCIRQNVNILVKNGKLPAKMVGGNYIFKLMDALNYKNAKKHRSRL